MNENSIIGGFDWITSGEEDPWEFDHQYDE